MTDNLLDEEELMGSGELVEDYEELLSLLDDDETPTKKMKMMSSTIQSTKEVEKEPQKAIAFSSLEKIEQENMLENELLDYDDDDVEDGDDEKERRESKFASERTEKPTNIEAILPQQKTAVKTEGETSTITNSDSGRGKGGYRGRGRGNWRPRGGK
uniref:Uncharacterized protein n=1 Tax=Panagrolaimus sp. JU765 TaxID=591449 RepID=A0AC34QF21_9BILA